MSFKPYKAFSLSLYCYRRGAPFKFFSCNIKGITFSVVTISDIVKFLPKVVIFKNTDTSLVILLAKYVCLSDAKYSRDKFSTFSNFLSSFIFTGIVQTLIEHVRSSGTIVR